MIKDTNLKKALEWFGVITAIFYSMLVASNTGFEVLGFALLFISALAIGLWALLCKHYGILLLQFFYASAGLDWCCALALKCSTAKLLQNIFKRPYIRCYTTKIKTGTIEWE